ncbi:MAG: BspA family leucine-rich repeat surface protein [Porphyromonadaceae bacterium]|nr:BspA family leucine-rich repeat surface protein [Porphyromonadaceae bacterium]
MPKTTATWFEGFSAVTEIRGLENLNTSEVTDMSRMFAGCSALRSLDLSSFDTSKVMNMGEMFLGCESLTTIYCNTSWSASHSDDMFSGCNSLRGAATNVGNSYDVSMANPETGYFTKKVLS